MPRSGFPSGARACDGVSVGARQARFLSQVAGPRPASSGPRRGAAGEPPRSASRRPSAAFICNLYNGN